MPPVNCCHVLLQPLARNVSSDIAGSIWATDVPGWITAVGTALLAVFAILTTIYAVRAFRKQSQEVSHQAEMLRVQSEQLAEQRKVNAEQIRVLGLQAAELHASLEERKREAVERKNAQARQVLIAVKRPDAGQIGNGRGKGPELEATVVNASEGQQPVYDVKLYWHLGMQPYGSPNPELLGTVLNWEKEARRRTFPPGTDPAYCGAVLAFRDAFEVNWIRTEDGGLMRADSELLPDLVRSLFGTFQSDDSPPHMVPDVGQ